MERLTNIWSVTKKVDGEMVRNVRFDEARDVFHVRTDEEASPLRKK